MTINIVAIGTNMPHWVNDGYHEYAKRLAGWYALKLCEIPAEKRLRKSNIAQIITNEGKKIQAAIVAGSKIVALDERGAAWTTQELAERLQRWQLDYNNITFLIGGPDGLAQQCLALAEEKWALSKLTLPHNMVRVIVAEQLYRAWSILTNHPYHRY